MSFRTALLARVEKIRGSVPGSLDLRTRTVTVRVTTWSGARPGVGTKTDVDTLLRNGTFNPKVVEVSSKDVVASGGKYQSGDLKIGPLTPEYAVGGTAGSTIDPLTTTSARQVRYLLEGPGFPDGGVWCNRVEDDALKNFSTFIVVRRTGQSP